MPDTSFDVIIIGSGPGGYVTAIRAVDGALGAELIAAFKMLIENPVMRMV